jgi:hypothetical protein
LQRLRQIQAPDMPRQYHRRHDPVHFADQVPPVVDKSSLLAAPRRIRTRDVSASLKTNKTRPEPLGLEVCRLRHKAWCKLNGSFRLSRFKTCRVRLGFSGPFFRGRKVCTHPLFFRFSKPSKRRK